MGVLDRANRTPVPPELLVEAIELFTEMPREEQSVFDVRTPRLVDFLRAKGFSGRHHADLVVAIIFRSYALAHLVRCEPVNGWIISAEERGMTQLHAEVIRAAAEEALVEDPDSVATFDVRSFARRILHLAQPQGGHEPALPHINGASRRAGHSEEPMTRIIEHREDAVAARRCSSCGFFNCGTLTCAPASFPPTCP